jgi:hypothetical protein
MMSEIVRPQADRHSQIPIRTAIDGCEKQAVAAATVDDVESSGAMSNPRKWPPLVKSALIAVQLFPLFVVCQTR